MRKIVIVENGANCPYEDNPLDADLVVLHTGITAQGEEATVDRLYHTAMRMRPDVIEIRLTANAE